ADPAWRPRPRPADIDVLADQEAERFLGPRPFDPNQPNVLGEKLEIGLGPPELQGGGMAQSDDDLAQIRDFLEVLNDPVEGRSFQLGVQTRKGKRDGAGLGVLEQFLFLPFQIGPAQPVQRGDRGRWVEVCRTASPTGLAQWLRV